MHITIPNLALFWGEKLNPDIPLPPALNALLQHLAHRYSGAAQDAPVDLLVSIPSLYGSFARGQATLTSDIDLFIVLDWPPPRHACPAASV